MNRQASRDLGQLKPALGFLRPYWPQVVIASAALVVTASVTLSVGQGLRYIIDAGLLEGTTDTLVQSILVFAALIVVLTAGTFIRFYYVSWIGERVSADLRTAVFRHLIRLHPGFFEMNLPTEIQSRITTDTTLLQTVIGSSVSIALRNMLMFLGGVVLLFVTNAKLSLVVLLSVPLVVFPILWFGRRVRRLSRSSQDTLAEVGSYAGESLRHIKVVQSFNHEPVDEVAFDHRVEHAFSVAVRRIRQRAWLVAVVMLLVMVAIGLMLWVGGQDVIAGGTSAGELAAFIFYAFIVAGSVGAISEVYSDLQRAAGATERLIELLHSPSELPEPGVSAVNGSANSEVLELVDVAFDYPSRPEVPVLTDVSFVVRSGEMVALVGPSGAGKSTIFDLIQRFYDPISGSVRLGGVDLRVMRLEQVRGSIGFVPQDPVLFAGSLRDNLTYGRPEAEEPALRAALESAHAAQFVATLPDGLDTSVGEGGVGLSGGQKQRLAIARAVLTEPQLLLLDEATSSLDAQSEQHIRESIDQLKGSCSILVIAHRLSTVRQADRIIVLDSGRVTAQGTHEELVRSNELYARFARIQFESPYLGARERALPARLRAGS
ncbi:MAG: ABC transporter transmembrane domain-containing protein [Pseudomonadales bacterium]|nr:ABC transporter transmembrane domain-containing protein [Pseudomonadales bacterium]MDP6470975.1 ABC transporter transmembrane domain-containing protein [Pseudomonadales bacterium]MDP6825840.1 ABC transporter transmembrane domain-containing protein [Pseudomonadales bacterium]MDP6972440.1 ABC transporter transmembrane domain-containing protein [Pseudomonadales bacterium]